MKIDGKTLTDKILHNLQAQINQIPPYQPKPKLIIILVGNNPASLSFIRQKIKVGKLLGVKVELKTYPTFVNAKNLTADIKTWAKDPHCHGIIIQRPLPPGLDVNQLNKLIPPVKDVDGFLENSIHLPPVGLAILEFLKRIHTQLKVAKPFIPWLKSQKIALLGYGQTAGKPIYKTLIAHGITLDIIRSQTINRKDILKSADIVISAVGKPEVLAANEIKPGSILLGVGLSYVGSKAVGDFNVKPIEQKVKFYTPTPGGVGPVNVACLYQNLLTAYNLLK